MCEDAGGITHVAIGESLDLHSFRPADVASVVEEYVHAAAVAGVRDVRFIHGRGRGVQRGIVQAVLARHPLVEAFWDAQESHLGATVARLRTTPSSAPGSPDVHTSPEPSA